MDVAQRFLCAVGLIVFLLGATISTSARAGWLEALEAISVGDDINAIEELKPLAAQGDNDAQYELGTIYFRAILDEPSQDLDLFGNPTLEMAFELLLPPAESGHLFAQYNIGFMYHEGLGVERDYGQAMYWLRKSADQGNQYAYYLVGEMYSKGEGAPRDKAEAARWYLQAANTGDIHGQYRLGIMRMQGVGVSLDLVLAHRWLRLSAAGGYDRARQALRELNEIITPAQIAEAERDGEDWVEKRGYFAKQKFADFHDLEKLLTAPEAPE